MNAAGGSGGAHPVIQRLSITRPLAPPSSGARCGYIFESSKVVSAWNFFGKCHLATCTRRGRASRAALQPRQSSCSAGMDARRPAHGYHGSREHGNERNAGGLHRSGLVRAGTGAGDAHWRDVHMLSAERSKGERGATLCVAPCKLRQKQKGVNHGPFGQKAPQRPPVARSHCAGSTNGGTSWLASAGVHYAVCTLCRCTRPERAKAPT